MTLTAKNMTLLELAQLGVWLDDPYGDGIRLHRVREPSEGRLAAKALIRGEPILGGEALIRAEYEKPVLNACFTKNGRLRGEVKRNLKFL